MSLRVDREKGVNLVSITTGARHFNSRDIKSLALVRGPTLCWGSQANSSSALLDFYIELGKLDALNWLSTVRGGSRPPGPHGQYIEHLTFSCQVDMKSTHSRVHAREEPFLLVMCSDTSWISCNKIRLEDSQVPLEKEQKTDTENTRSLVCFKTHSPPHYNNTILPKVILIWRWHPQIQDNFVGNHKCIIKSGVRITQVKGKRTSFVRNAIQVLSHFSNGMIQSHVTSLTTNKKIKWKVKSVYLTLSMGWYHTTYSVIVDVI